MKHVRLHMLERRDNFQKMTAAFSWNIPDYFNIGTACSDAFALTEPDRIAMIHDDGSGKPVQTMTYGILRDKSDALAHGLVGLGVNAGDRVAIYLPQGFEVAIAHLAIYKMGAIAVPLALLFGPEALEHRLKISGARAIICNQFGLEKLSQATIPACLEQTIVTGQAAALPIDAISFDHLLSENSQPFHAIKSKADDPALMIFTSGTTGAPKGALHAHRVLLGHIPGVQVHHEFMPQQGDRIWTPADWAWAGGLLNVLLPGLYLGVPVVSGPFERFNPEGALAFMERNKIANAFIPPTALRLLKTVDNISVRFKLSLRTIGSGGEALGAETFEWGQKAFGLMINEFYGQTECNLVLSSMAALDVVRAGAIGKSVPGHVVDVVDETGKIVADGVSGQIAIRRPDPVMFLEYWNDPVATKAKFIGDWLLTGDQGRRDQDGYIHFFGRDDDVITSAGYRIGPAEIEDCLIRHPAIALCAVIGKPDPMRTEIVKAFIMLKKGFAPSDALANEISLFVRERLSAHEYPREIAFVDDLPMTTTGKIIRRQLRDAETK